MWMQHRFDRVTDFAAAARELGFGGIEVSHIVTPAMLADADVATLGVRSVHFPAPIRPSPFGQPAEALLSSPDDKRAPLGRGAGLRQHRSGRGVPARPAVCLHLGETPASTPPGVGVGAAFSGRPGGTAVYDAALAEVEADRQRVAGPALDAARRSLEELAGYARPRGVGWASSRASTIGRYRRWTSWRPAAGEQRPGAVGFWYDCGHVQVLHNLGFHEHERLAGRPTPGASSASTCTT